MLGSDKPAVVKQGDVSVEVVGPGVKPFDGFPETFTQYTPGSTQFSQGVAKLKQVVKAAQKHIVFDDHVMGLLKKYGDQSTSGGSKGKCCC